MSYYDITADSDQGDQAGPNQSNNYRRPSRPRFSNKTMTILVGVSAVAVLVLTFLLNQAPQLADSRLFVAVLVVAAFIWGMVAMRFFDEYIAPYIFERNLAKVRGQFGLKEKVGTAVESRTDAGNN